MSNTPIASIRLGSTQGAVGEKQTNDGKTFNTYSIQLSRLNKETNEWIKTKVYPNRNELSQIIAICEELIRMEIVKQNSPSAVSSKTTQTQTTKSVGAEAPKTEDIDDEIPF